MSDVHEFLIFHFVMCSCLNQIECLCWGLVVGSTLEVVCVCVCVCACVYVCVLVCSVAEVAECCKHVEKESVE